MDTFFHQIHNNIWGLLLVAILGNFMAILNNNIVNVALPKIMANFGSTVHCAHYLEQISDVFSPTPSRALSTMQELPLRYGHGPAATLAKGKSLPA